MKQMALLASQGALSLFATTFLFGIFGVLSRLIGVGFPVYYLTAFRSLITSAVLLILLLNKKSFRGLRSVDAAWVVVRSISRMVGVIGFFIAVNAVPLGTSYFILYVGILVTGYTAGYFLFHERLKTVNYIALGVAVLGLWLLYDVVVGASPLYYLALLFLSGIGASLWNILPKKISALHTSESLAFWDNFLGALIVFAVSLLTGERWIMPAWTPVWGYNAIFSLLMVATGQLVVYGFRHIDSHVGNIIMLGEVMFGILFGSVLYHESISARMAVGGLLIVLAMALPDLHAVTKERKFI